MVKICDRRNQMSTILAIMTYFLKQYVVFVSYIKNNAFPHPLTKEEEEKYVEAMLAGDTMARDKLIEHNLRLVAHIVKKYGDTNEKSEDLISIGTIGLIKGVESFKANKGAKLATYCARCIDNEILMYLRSLKKSNKDVSLYSPIGQDLEGNEMTLADILEADIEDIVTSIEKHIEIEKLNRYIHLLSERELFVIIHRYGIHKSEILTQKKIAKQLNISRSYVSRIEKRALMKLLRAYIREEENKS